MRRLSFLLLLTTSLWVSSCQEKSKGEATSPESPEASSVTVNFICEPISPSEEEPHYALYATVDDLKVKLSEISACEPIDSAHYGDYQIPAEALAAAGGWWAGAGDYFYARQSGNQIEFFQGALDEQDEVPNDFGYHLIASYQDGKFSYQQ